MALHYYDERRKFLSLFFEHEDRGFQILAYSFALPVKAFRSFLWEQNVDMQDLESYVRRMTDEQFEALKNAYLSLFAGIPVLPSYCGKGWKHIFHKPSLIEIKDEPRYDEYERFQQNWAVVKDEFGLGIGFTKYRGSEDDTVNVKSSYLSKKDHENYKDQGHSEFVINPNGPYGIATRKVFGNYLWGDFEKQKVGGWVCPRFWTTFLLYFMLLVVSPISCSIFTFGGIDNAKMLLWLGLFGSFLPLLVFAYVSKYSTKKFFEYSTKLLDKFTPIISSFFRTLEVKVSDFFDTKNGEVFFSVFLHLVYFSVSIVFLSLAYNFVVSIAISGVFYYYIDNCLFKKRFISFYGMKYGKYAVFFLISIHLVYGWEFIVEVLLAFLNFSLFCFNFLMIYYAHIFVVLFSIVLFYKIFSKVKTYIDIQDYYIQDNTTYDVFVLFDKLITFIYCCIILVIIVAVSIMFTEMQSVLTDLKWLLLPMGAVFLFFFTVEFFLIQSPTYLENEKKRYMKGNKVMSGGFRNIKSTIAVSDNKWLLESGIDIFTIYKLYDKFVPKKDTYFEDFYIEFLNRLDSDFFEQVKLLREMMDDKGLGTNYLYLEKLIRSDMKAEEVMNYFEKIDEVKNKVWSIVTYPFRRGFYYICRFFTLVYSIYRFFVDTFHKMCPYANSSEQI